MKPTKATLANPLRDGPPIKQAIRSSNLERLPYRCAKCRKTTHLSEMDIWGKIIRCVHCTAQLMDNRHTLTPKQ